jgi:hypothetical protein
LDKKYIKDQIKVQEIFLDLLEHDDDLQDERKRPYAVGRANAVRNSLNYLKESERAIEEAEKHS